MKNFSFVLFLCLLALLAGCSPSRSASSLSHSSTAEKPESERNEAGFIVRETLPVEAPSRSPEQAQDVSISIDKSEHTLTLYSGSQAIAVYSVGIGKKSGPKEKEGDKKTPEGSYYVCTRNEYSKFHLALGLSYPNDEDAQRGYEAGLITKEERDTICRQIAAGQRPNWETALGGEIMIHGQKGDMGGECDWSTGCVTVDNEVIDILWEYCPIGTPVIIMA